MTIRSRPLLSVFAIVTSCGDPAGPSAAIVASVSVTAASPSIEVGQSVELVGAARDSAGSVVAGKTLTGSTSNAAVAALSGTGTVTAIAPGAATIKAAVDGKEGSLALAVIVAVGSVTISGPATGEVGTAVQLAAVVKDPAGSVIDVPVTWSSSNASLIDVSASGEVIGTRIGTVVVTATAGSNTGALSFATTLSPYTFNLGSASAADAQIIRDGVAYAHACGV